MFAPTRSKIDDRSRTGPPLFPTVGTGSRSQENRHLEEEAGEMRVTHQDRPPGQTDPDASGPEMPAPRTTPMTGTSIHQIL